jgi:hypothetical protein
MSDELNSHDVMISKGPLGHEIERFPGKSTTADPTIKPVERFGPTRREVELNAHLTSAYVRRWKCHGETGETSGPPLLALLNPLPRLLLRHCLGHHRESRDVGIPARLGDRRSVSDPERPEPDVGSGQRWIGWHEIRHKYSVAEVGPAAHEGPDQLGLACRE